MEYINNNPINCIYCGMNNIKGREESYKDRRGNTVLECKWICPRCLKLVRCDEKVIKKTDEKESKSNKTK